MPRAGETIANPATGETLTWVVTAADSGGSLLRVDVVMEPGRPGPPVHVHRAFPEHHDVKAGRLAIVLDGQERVLEAGATIDIPRGTPHTFRVVGDEQVRTVVDYAHPDDVVLELRLRREASRASPRGRGRARPRPVPRRPGWRSSRHSR